MESITKASYRRSKPWFAFILVMVFLTSSLTELKAQTWGEFFNQKKTQKRYLLQQIAAIQVYSGYVKKGYGILGDGLNMVRDFKEGEFNLHQLFFSSLKSVSPAVRNNAKIAEIISLQLSINKSFQGLKSNPYLSIGNREYIRSVKEKVLADCGKSLEKLLLVITSGKVEMKDAERINRLDQIYFQMKDRSAFTQYFLNEVGLLTVQKAREQQETGILKNTYGITQ